MLHVDTGIAVRIKNSMPVLIHVLLADCASVDAASEHSIDSIAQAGFAFERTLSFSNNSRNIVIVLNIGDDIAVGEYCNVGRDMQIAGALDWNVHPRLRR